MNIREHKGFDVQIHRIGERYAPEVYRKGKLIHTIHNDEDANGGFNSTALAFEAAREWIDHTYPPGKIEYFGEI